MSIESRLKALESHATSSEGWELEVERSDDEVTAELGQVLGVDLSGVSRTPEDAARKGYACIEAEVAATLGMSYVDWLHLQQEAASDYEHSHEWRRVAGRLYVRESSSPR